MNSDPLLPIENWDIILQLLVVQKAHSLLPTMSRLNIWDPDGTPLLPHLLRQCPIFWGSLRYPLAISAERKIPLYT